MPSPLPPAATAEGPSRAGTATWLALAALAIAAGSWLRIHALGSQIIIDDEWHALHKLMRAPMLDIVTHLDYADYSIPMTVYLRWLQDTVGITEWGMHLPMLAAGIALIVAGPWLARAWAPLPARATWAVLLAVSPLLVYFSRTARPYALTALAATIALIAFERWWRSDRHRKRWAVAYVAATFAGGYLHMTSLAFTLMPFLYFGARAIAGDRRGLPPLLRMALATALPLAAALLPPVINDWFMFTAKAGVDSVTPESGYRTVLMLAGTARAGIAAALVACAGFGMRRWWQRDRVLAGYVLAVAAGGTLAVIAARPNWVQHPLVFARYLVPLLPLFLLLAAEGLAATLRALPPPGAAALAALAGAGLWWSGPLPAQSYVPNQFTGHLRFQFDYDDAHNPYVSRAVVDPVPAFYRDLAARPPGSVTLIEAPWRLESHFNPHAWYQQVHRQNILIGLTTPWCGRRDFGEYPEAYVGFRFANFVHVAAVLRGDSFGADYLVMRLAPWSVPPGEPVPWPDIERCLPQVESALGAPVFRDDQIAVFDLRQSTARAHGR
jgi:hypothetical protein